MIHLLCSFHIKSWTIKHVQKHNESISMIEIYWTWGQSETTALTGWFQSSDHNGYRNKK